MTSRTITTIVLGLTLAVAPGCAYRSVYVPPPDGRARAVWSRNTVLAHLSRDAGPECARAVIETATGKPAPLVPMEHWQDRSRARYGTGVGVVLFWPWVFAPVPVPLPLFYSPDSKLWNALTYLAVAAVVVLPFVDIGLAADAPEDERSSVAAIDAVNAYNDLARSEDNPCTLGDE